MKYSTFEDLTVGQYQELYRIHTSKEDELEKSIQSVAVLTGTTPKQVEELSLREFNLASAELAVIFSTDPISVRPPKFLQLNGKKYAIEYNVRNLSAGQYIEIQAWLKGGMIENMHKVIASLIYRVNFWSRGKNDPAEHEINSEFILDCNFLQIHAVCVFFSLLWNNSIKALVPYLKKDILKKIPKNQHKEMMEVLQKALDGSIMQDKLPVMNE